MDEFSTSITSTGTSSKSVTRTSFVQNHYYGSYISDDDTYSYSKIFKLLIKTSIPKILSSFLSLLIITVNIIWFGHHSSSTQFAGILLAITMINISLNIGIMSLISGLDKFFNYSYRASLYKMVGTYTQRYIIIIHFVIATLAIILYYLSKDILIYIFGQTDSNAHNASIYINFFLIAFWPISMFALLRKYIQSFFQDNHNIFIFIALLIAIILEMPLTYLLINRHELEIKGLSISIAVTYWTALISLYLISMSHPKIKENVGLTYPGCGHWIYNMKEMSIYLKHSMTKSIYIAFELCMLEVFVFFAGRFDTEYLCAYVISLDILKLFQRIPYAISRSSTILIKNYGNENGNAARRIWNASILLNIITISILTATMLSIAYPLGLIYTSNNNIAVKVKKTLPFTCLFFFFDSLLRCFICGMHGIHRGSMASIIYIICYYCFGFPLGIIYGYKGFLSIHDPRFRHINGLWLGASFGIFVSLCMLILIRIRIDWESEVKRAQKLLGEEDIKIEQFRNRMLAKYGRYSTYGINSALIDDENSRSPSSDKDHILSSGHYDWSTSENIIREDDSEIHFTNNSRTRSGAGHYKYYGNQYDIQQHKSSDNISESVQNPLDMEDNQTPLTNPINYGSGIVSTIPPISIDDYRIRPYSTGRSIPQSIASPQKENAKHGPIVI